MRKVCIVLGWLLLGVCGSRAQPQGANAVSGKVQGEDGIGIANAIVTLIPEFEATTARLRRDTIGLRPQASGSFAVKGLGPGIYRVCAKVPGSTWLDPCEWGGKPLVVRLGGASPPADLTVTMKKGVAVQVLVDDPGQLLSKHEGKTPGAHLMIGVGNDAGMFVPARVLARDAALRSYQTMVPLDTPVNLVVYSKFFRLAEDKGSAIARSGTRIPIVVRSGQQPAVILLRVVGLNGF